MVFEQGLDVGGSSKTVGDTLKNTPATRKFRVGCRVTSDYSSFVLLGMGLAILGGGLGVGRIITAGNPRRTKVPI